MQKNAQPAVSRLEIGALVKNAFISLETFFLKNTETATGLLKDFWMLSERRQRAVIACKDFS